MYFFHGAEATEPVSDRFETLLRTVLDRAATKCSGSFSESNTSGKSFDGSRITSSWTYGLERLSKPTTSLCLARSTSNPLICLILKSRLFLWHHQNWSRISFSLIICDRRLSADDFDPLHRPWRCPRRKRPLTIILKNISSFKNQLTSIVWRIVLLRWNWACHPCWRQWSRAQSHRHVADERWIDSCRNHLLPLPRNPSTWWSLFWNWTTNSIRLLATGSWAMRGSSKCAAVGVVGRWEVAGVELMDSDEWRTDCKRNNTDGNEFLMNLNECAVVRWMDKEPPPSQWVQLDKTSGEEVVSLAEDNHSLPLALPDKYLPLDCFVLTNVFASVDREFYFFAYPLVLMETTDN